MAATGIEALITEALLQRVLALGISLSLSVAVPDVQFPANGDPKPDTYLQAHVLRAKTQSIGISAWDEHAGILQVDVVYSTTAGPLGPTNIADAIAAGFPRGWTVTNSGVRVSVYETPSVAAAIADEDPYKRIPVSIRYRSFTS